MLRECSIFPIERPALQVLGDSPMQIEAINAKTISRFTALCGFRANVRNAFLRRQYNPDISSKEIELSIGRIVHYLRIRLLQLFFTVVQIRFRLPLNTLFLCLLSSKRSNGFKSGEQAVHEIGPDRPITFRETLHRDILERSEHSALGTHLAGTTFLCKCLMARLLVNLVDGSVESPVDLAIQRIRQLKRTNYLTIQNSGPHVNFE
ncbi:hypothetical protein EVAR_95487_1 [Eumeta japonica]|uniref:Uncharacterized protein n=1 Tax=Eumeta variegata TaxID=151549 RepID=A0A4C1UK25_EUMVA|nr:hypothetical protein EVAR_95487_1 [Eumeta japonica]